MKVALYRALPGPLRSAARRAASLLPMGLRMGGEYRRMRTFLRESAGWDRERIRDWQSARVRTVVEHAYEHVPGYRELWKRAGVGPGDIRAVEDVRRLPFVTKEMIRDRLEAFTSRAVPERRRLYRTTGGSTGIPFGFHITQQDIEREYAFLHEGWEAVGWKSRDWSALLRGAFIGSEEKLWERDPALRHLWLSAYYLTDRTYPRFRDLLLKARPRHLQAYPSAAMIFADLVLAHGDAERIRFDLLLLGSENLYPWQRERILAAFPGARIHTWYGHAEQVLFAPECPRSERLHLHPFYGFGEILGPDDRPVEPGERGELVGTSLWSLATPFIRYRTLDVAVHGGTSCPGCGRAFPVLEGIEGRRQEFILSREGRLISMTQINMHSDVFDHVRQFQFHQAEAGKVTFRFVAKDAYGEDDARGIRRELTEKLGEDFELTLEGVDRIEPLPSGKFTFLVQELPLDRGDAHGRS